jgi:hypothetical protein
MVDKIKYSEETKEHDDENQNAMPRGIAAQAWYRHFQFRHCVSSSIQLAIEKFREPISHAQLRL